MACGVLLEAPSAGPVCAACWRSIHPLSSPLCDRCGEPVAPERVTQRLPGSVDLPTGGMPARALLCPRCRHEPSQITLGRSAGAYEGALRRMIHALKYEGRRGLAGRLSALMRERGAEVLAGADLAVPVPLHWRRRLARGFNQADDLACELGLPVCRALSRTRATRPQFGLRLGARRRNVHAAFSVRRRLAIRFQGGAGYRGLSVLLEARHAARVAGSCVVLVDDLTTTGATLRECAEVLRRLGAREVRTLTAARALAQRP